MTKMDGNVNAAPVNVRGEFKKRFFNGLNNNIDVLSLPHLSNRPETTKDVYYNILASYRPFFTSSHVFLGRYLSPLPSTGWVREDSWQRASQRCFDADSKAAANQKPLQTEQRDNWPIEGEMWPAKHSPLLKRQGRVSSLQRRMLP